MMRITHLLVTLIIASFFKVNIANLAFSFILQIVIDLEPRKLHRKLFHNIFFVIFLTPLITILNLNLQYQLLSLIVHLFLDSLTLKGIFPFYPVSNLKVNFIFKNKSFIDYLILLSSIIFLVLKALHGF